MSLNYYSIGGCGLARNIYLYPNFSITSITQINPFAFMNSVTEPAILYSMIKKGDKSILIDESGNDLHVFN